MKKGPLTQKSLIDQIIDEMFVSIEPLEEFDDQIIQQLKELASSGSLSKPKKVTEKYSIGKPGGHKVSENKCKYPR